MALDEEGMPSGLGSIEGFPAQGIMAMAEWREQVAGDSQVGEVGGTDQDLELETKAFREHDWQHIRERAPIGGVRQRGRGKGGHSKRVRPS